MSYLKDFQTPSNRDELFRWLLSANLAKSMKIDIVVRKAWFVVHVNQKTITDVTTLSTQACLGESSFAAHYILQKKITGLYIEANPPKPLTSRYI